MYNNKGTHLMKDVHDIYTENYIHCQLKLRKTTKMESDSGSILLRYQFSANLSIG